MKIKRIHRGNTLLVVIAILTALVALVGAAIQYTQGVVRRAQRERANVSAQAIGDGCFDLMFSAWRQICRRDAPVMSTEPWSFGVAYTSPFTYYPPRWSPPGTNAFNNIPLPTAAMFSNVPGFSVTRGAMTGANETVSNFKIQAIDASFTLTTADPPLTTIPVSQQPPGAYYGTTFYYRADASWYYLASADITLNTPAGRVTTKMRRIFEKKMTKPSNYLMFFNDDLELNANSTAPLTLYGQVHTNGTLYTGANSLTFNATVPILTGGQEFGGSGPVFNNPSAPGTQKTQGVGYGESWVIGYKSGDTVHGGTPALPTLAANTPVQRVPKLIPFDWDEIGWNGGDANLNNDGPIEFIEKPSIPLTTHPDPLGTLVGDRTNSTYGAAGAGGINVASMYFATQRFYTRCGIRIHIDANNVVTVRNAVNTPNPTLDPHYGDGELLTSTFIGPNTTDNLTADYYLYRWAHDMYKTALGVSPGTVAAGANALNTGQILSYRRVTNGATVTGTKRVTSATMAFLAADIGRLLKGRTAAGVNIIPEGAKINSLPATTIAAASNGLTLPRATINVAATASWSALATGQIRVLTTLGSQLVTYTGKTATTFTGCTGGTGTMTTGNAVSSATEVLLAMPASTANPVMAANGNFSASTANLILELEGASSRTGALAPNVVDLQDPREAQSVELITLDLDVFKAWDGGSASNYFHTPPNWTWAGGGAAPDGDPRHRQTEALAFYGPNIWNVYISVAQVGGRRRAIRIKNGGRVARLNPDPGASNVPPTISSMVPFGNLVTDAPLYIWGDIGTGRILANAATQPKSNVNAGPRTSVYEDPIPADGVPGGGPQFIADAVTVLSNAWEDDDAHLSGPLNGRIASNTTINARIIAGDVPTTAANGYSGGGENFIRLLEDWTGKYFTFCGTLTQLYHSKVATGTWGKANVYVEPKPDGAGVGGRYYYQATWPVFGNPDEVKAFGYFKHRWSPTP